MNKPATPAFTYKQFEIASIEIHRKTTLYGDTFFRAMQAEAEAAIARLHERKMRYLTEPLNAPPIDPLDVNYDGVTLRVLLIHDERARRDRNGDHPNLATPAQRAAISAHWSAELRAKVAASKRRDRNRVTMEHDE